MSEHGIMQNIKSEPNFRVIKEYQVYQVYIYIKYKDYICVTQQYEKDIGLFRIKCYQYTYQYRT